MEQFADINILRAENEEKMVEFKRALLGGYQCKDVDRFIESLTEDKEKIVKAYSENISELQTSLSMTARERDKAKAEMEQLIDEIDKKRAELERITAENEALALSNKELTEQVNMLNSYIDELDQERPAKEIVCEPQRREPEDVSERRVIELKVENEELIKNFESQKLNIEQLNKQILDLTDQLSNERASSQAEILKLQGEIHQKNVSWKLIKSNILGNLSVIAKDIEKINN